MKVFIPAAGIGARLGDLTNYLPKTLVSIGGKPALSHIIDAYYPKTQFVIALGHQGELIKEFMGLVYPRVSVEYVDVFPYQGPGSSLLHSMVAASHLLQEPFVLHCSDTIVKGSMGWDLADIQDPAVFGGNWSGVVPKTEGTAEYRTVLVGQEPGIHRIYDKGIDNGTHIHIGLIGVQDHAKFWGTAHEIITTFGGKTDLSDVDVINAMGGFKARSFPEWYDIGNMDAFHKTVAAIGDPELVVLPKPEQAIYMIGDSVVKFFNDTQAVSNRVARAKQLFPAVPQMQGSTPHFFKYKKAPGKLFNMAFPGEVYPLLKWCQDTLWVHSGGDIHSMCAAFYYHKTCLRVSNFYTITGLVDQEETINGVQVPTLKELMKRVPWQTLYEGKSTTHFHGDLHFSNIIVSPERKYTLIDWREDFGGAIDIGDVYYDLAKLQHGMIVAHDLVDSGQFVIEYEDPDNITVDIMRRHRTVQCLGVFRNFLLCNDYDTHKVDLLTALIFLNICPLHEYPYNFFLYYLGKKMLFDLL